MTVLLWINEYSTLLITIMILFFLKKIFESLNQDFKFHKKLANKTKTLGILLIFSTLFKFLISIIFFYCYDIITITSSINNQTILNPTNVLIYPRLNFSFGHFLIGLSIIILSALLKKGNNLQQENELTV